MKTFIFIFLFVFTFVNGHSQTIIKFRNNTDKVISVAYAYWEVLENCWTSTGWFNVDPYQYKELDLGDYVGNVYIHGRQTALWGLSATTWGSDASFCIDLENAFNIKFADVSKCNKKANFSKLKVFRGTNKWLFNP